MRTRSTHALAIVLLSAGFHPNLFVLRAQTPEDGPGTILTEEQAVAEGLQNNLVLLAERVNLTIAEASIITARLRPNPVFSFGSDHLDWVGYGFNELNGGGPTEIAWRVDLPIEREGKRRFRTETAGLAKDVAQARLLDSIRTLTRELRLACVDVIQAKANLELARDNLRALEELVRINEARVQAGSIPPLELTRSRVAMLQFQGNVKRAELELATAKMKLELLLGRKTPSGQFDLMGELKVAHDNDLDLKRLAEIARGSRPDLRAQELSMARSHSELQLQLAQAKVDYTLGSEFRRQAGVNGRSNSIGFFFSVPLPVYNRNQGEIARVRAESEQLLRQMRFLEAQVLSEINTAHQEFQSARELVDSIERSLLKPAQEARDTVAYVYRAGAATLMEYLDAQRAYNDSRQTYHEALAVYRKAVIRVNAACGQEVVR
jgi:cobalt-zinc-cadmium efflux system outer membrane protein